ncbi:MAG: putative toxin-antitoxin system toxin component, PIN family [Luteimonas sp.]
MMSPAIVDTNVVVAGLLTARANSPVVQILDGMLKGAFPFVLSTALLAEYRTVLARPKLRRAHGLNESEIDIILLEMAQHAIELQPAPAHEAPDPGDQFLWELLAARDDLLLITGDKRLHQDTSMQSRVVMPDRFVALWRADG